jgi:hypothetical protein
MTAQNDGLFVRGVGADLLQTALPQITPEHAHRQDGATNSGAAKNLNRARKTYIRTDTFVK